MSRSQNCSDVAHQIPEPWEVLEVDLQKIPNTSEAENEYLLLVVDGASRSPIRLPTLKEAHGVARLLLDTCLTLGVPPFIAADPVGGDSRRQ